MQIHFYSNIQDLAESTEPIDLYQPIWAYASLTNYSHRTVIKFEEKEKFNIFFLNLVEITKYSRQM